MNKGSHPHQGLLLRELINWSNLSEQSFADKVEISRVWLRKLCKEERLARKNIMNISRAFDIPLIYWDGKISIVDIPLKTGEPEVEYKLLNNPLQEKVNQLQRELYEAQKKIISLQEELLKYHIFPDTARN